MTERDIPHSLGGDEHKTALVAVPNTAATHVPGPETTGAIDKDGKFVVVHPEYVIDDETGQVIEIRPWEPRT